MQMRPGEDEEAKEPLTDRQRAVLEFISQSIESRGYPPTLREIGEHFGIRSTNGVNDHLKALEKKGVLRREDLKSRAMRPITSPPVGGGSGADVIPIRRASTNGFANVEAIGDVDDSMCEVPIIGRVAAGTPIL